MMKQSIGTGSSGTSRSRWSGLQNLCLIAFAIVLMGCSSVFKETTADPERRTTQSTPSTPQNKTSFLVWYSDSTGLRLLNTSANTDTVVLYHRVGLPTVRVSPNGHMFALPYYTNDSCTLVVFSSKGDQAWAIKSVSNTFTFTFGWSPDSKLLGIGYYSMEDFLGKLPKPRGELFKWSVDDKCLRTIPCRVAKRFEAWLPDGNMVVAGPKNLYVVDSTSCNTLSTVSTTNKLGIVLSPDGRHMLYRNRTSVYSEAEGRTLNVDELFVANADGTEITKALGYERKPRNAKWSPDSKTIVCDIESPRWSNVRNLAIFDLQTKKARLLVGEDALGAVEGEEPYWSPSGSKIVYDRYKRYDSDDDRTPSFVELEKVVHEFDTNRSRVIISGRSYLYSVFDSINEPTGGTLGWAGDSVVVSFTTLWTRFYDMNGSLLYSMPPTKWPVLVLPID